MSGHTRTILAALAVLAVYAASLSLFPRHVFWMPDEGAKYIELHAVHWEGDVRYAVPFPTRRIDPDFQFLPDPNIFPHPSIAHDGNLYLGFETSVLFPLVSRVPFQLFGLTGIYLLPLLSGWGVALVAGALMARLHRPWAPFAVLLTGLATPVWFYSMVFWEHTVACLFALLAVYTIAAAPRWRLAALLLAIATLTVAVILRLEMLAFAVAVFIGWGISIFAARSEPAVAVDPPQRTRRPLPPWIIYVLLIALAGGMIVILDASLTLRHRKLLATAPGRAGPALTDLFTAPRALVEVFIHSAFSEGPAVSDAAATTVGIAVLACFLAAFVTSARIEAILVLPGCLTMLAFGYSLLFSGNHYRSLHGLFPVAPFLIVWPYALRQAWRQRSHVLLVLTNISLVALATGLAAISMLYLWQGQLQVGMEWGQRYLLVLYPMLTVATLATVQAYHRSDRPLWLRRAFSAVVGAMMIVGVGLEIRGLRMLYDTRQQLATWDSAMRMDGPVVTDVWWLPSAVAVFSTERELFFLSHRADLARWVELAAQHGVDHFTFASVEPSNTRDLGARGIQRVSERSVNGLRLVSFALLPLDGR